jgi:hypothetical protein
MADNANKQYMDPGVLFGAGSGDYSSTGAPGTQGVTAAEDAAPLATVEVTPSPYWSAQLGGLPRATVSVGDTSAYSSDNPVPVNPLLPDAAGAGATGAGTGHVGGAPHPNAAAGRGPEV